jgi:hypothetical protein
MTMDQVIWLNQAEGECNKLLAKVGVAKSSRRREDLDFALATLENAAFHAHLAIGAIQSAKNGTRFPATRPMEAFA